MVKEGFSRDLLRFKCFDKWEKERISAAAVVVDFKCLPSEKFQGSRA